jgi:hypothetical protein
LAMRGKFGKIQDEIVQMNPMILLIRTSQVEMQAETMEMRYKLEAIVSWSRVRKRIGESWRIMENHSNLQRGLCLTHFFPFRLERRCLTREWWSRPDR